MTAAGRQIGRGSRVACWALLVAGVVTALMALGSASASAAPCPGGWTSWLGGSGSFNEDANWSNGGPSGSCDTFITTTGTYTVSMTSGAVMKSLTLGGAGSSPTLVISAVSPNTNLNTTTTGIDIKPGASVVLTCPPLPGGCNGGPTTGGSSLGSGSSPFTNQGTITVDPASGTGATITGPMVNTGTVQIEQDTRLNNGAVVNQGALSIANGKTLTSSGSSCGDTSVSVKNDIGGSINATGTGTLNVVNYEQGNGTTSGAVPVNIPCGSLKYTGGGASKVQATGGFSLAGEVQSNQSLTVLSQSNNTNVTLGTDLVNKGSITLSCFPAVLPALSGCNGGDPGAGVGFNVNGHQFTNAGALTVAAASGTGANIDSGSGGTVTNTGTMQFDQSARLSGLAVNKGALNIADGKIVKASSSSCGSGEPVKNEIGGSINATGTGTFEISTTYEQGDGTTSGAIPVSMPCGNLKYTGSGTSNVRATGGLGLSGDMQTGQSLTVLSQSNNTNVTLGTNLVNKGSITLSCDVGGCSGGASGGAGFNVNGHQFTNAGTLTVAAASGTGVNIDSGSGGTIANTGTMQFDQEARLNGVVVNKGPINIADGKGVTSNGGCGGGPVKNETGGSINATGTGALFVGNYEQGNGTTTGANPVQLYGGCLKYTGTAGAGASKVLAYAGFDLSGEMQAGQELTVTNNSANTNLRLVSPFTSKGSITFTCPSSPCNGPGFNGNGNLFVNAGTFTVDAAASNGTTLDMSSGGMTNAAAGTFQLNGNTNFNGAGPLSNQGTLRIVIGASTPTFTNAGTIVLDQSATNPLLNTGTLTNTGTLATSGPSAHTSSVNGTIDQTGSSALVSIPAGTKLSVNNSLLLKAGRLSGGGTLQGSANNSGGTVAPGASPGTLTVSGDYTQGKDGSLEVEVAGTGAGQFDKLVLGGAVTLDGALKLVPTAGYTTSSLLGDSIEFLAWGGTRTNPFASTTTSPSLACPKQFTVAYDDGAKKVNAVVSSSGAVCGGGGGSGGSPSAPPPVSGGPAKPVKKAPVRCKKGFRKVKAKGKLKCKKIKKKHGKR